MILKIAVQAPNNSRFCFIDCIPQLSVPDAINDQIYREINERASYLSSELRPGLIVGSSLVKDGYLVSFKSLPMIKERVEKFFEVYGRNLEGNMRNAPEEYLGTFASTFERMKIAILEGSYYKDSETFKAVCKDLKIKCTYKAIDAFLKGE